MPIETDEKTVPLAKDCSIENMACLENESMHAETQGMQEA